MRQVFLAVIGAALLVAAQAPFGLWPLGLVGIVPLAILAEADVTPRRRYLAAYVGGVVFFGVGCVWLAVPSVVNLMLMTFPEALAFPLFVATYRQVRRRVPRPIALAVTWVAIEVVRARLPWGGFPWLLVGYSLDRPLELAQAADVGGVSLLSFVVAVANGSFLQAWMRRRDPRRSVWLGVPPALLLFLYGYGALRIASVAGDEGPGPRLLLVQANLPQGLKQRHDFETIARYQLAATEHGLRRSEGRPFDLLCWAESMFPGVLPHRSGAAADDADRAVAEGFIEPFLGEFGAWFLTGAITRDGAAEARRDWNSVLLYDPAGRRQQLYSKTILVPGGEFIPFREALPDAFIRMIEGFAGFLPDLARGEGPVVFELETASGQEFRFSTTICYENVYPSYCVAVARQGIDFVVNLSNEGWFGQSWEFDQMEVASRFRAIEMRRSLVRVTNSGVSAVYDACGRTRARIEEGIGRDRDVAGSRLVDVPIHRGGSVFVRSGDVVGFFATLSTALFLAPGLLRRVRRYLARRKK